MDRTHANDLDSEIVRGQVDATSPEGVKVGGRWWHYRQDALVEPPAMGQVVEVEAEHGVIRRLAILASPDPTAGPLEARETAGKLDEGVPHQAERERVTLRLTVLTAAATFLAPRLETTAPDVLHVAEAWETWVLREG